MTFVQVEFILFFCILLLFYWGMPIKEPQKRTVQNLLLLFSSLFFYGFVEPWLIMLLLFSTTLDYCSGLGMAHYPQRKRWFLSMSLVGNLSVLFLFKYFDWFSTSFASAAQLLGLSLHPYTLGLILPIGISFYTFQTLSYTIDVYKGVFSPKKNFLEYATFVCMFPQLVAGPIERASVLIPQIEQKRMWSTAQFRAGFSLMLWGFFQKLVIADTVSLYVDQIFALPRPDPVLVWTATIGFMIQILADFGGYTSIARGVARMLGFSLSENFRRPYHALSPSDFWRRWHISLSSWMHQYIYIPLGGSKKGSARWIFAVWATMLISGLWHGAQWNMIIWGALHALWLCVWKAVGPRIAIKRKQLRKFLAWGLMMLLHPICWLFFRQEDIDSILYTLRYFPLSGDFHSYLVSMMSAGVFTIGIFSLWLGGYLREKIEIQTPRHKALEQLGWAMAICLILLFAQDTTKSFIYFRF